MGLNPASGPFIWRSWVETSESRKPGEGASQGWRGCMWAEVPASVPSVCPCASLSRDSWPQAPDTDLGQPWLSLMSAVTLVMSGQAGAWSFISSQGKGTASRGEATSLCECCSACPVPHASVGWRYLG